MSKWNLKRFISAYKILYEISRGLIIYLTRGLCLAPFRYPRLLKKGMHFYKTKDFIVGHWTRAILFVGLCHVLSWRCFVVTCLFKFNTGKCVTETESWVKWKKSSEEYVCKLTQRWNHQRWYKAKCKLLHGKMIH